MIKMFRNGESRLFFSILCLLCFVLLEEAPAAEFADVKSLGKAAEPTHDVSSLILAVGHDQHDVFIVDAARSGIVRKFRLTARINSEPVFSPAGRFAYLFSEDGWLARFDLSTLKQVAMRQLKQRINSVAVSADGRFLLIARNQPAALQLLKADSLEALKQFSIPHAGADVVVKGAVRTLNQRNSFVAPIMMVDKKTQVRQSQVWEIITRDNPLPVYNGPMHDYQLDEGVAKQAGKFPVSKIKLDQCAANCLKNILVTAPTGLLVSSDGNQQIRLAQMDARRQIATINLPETLDLAQGVVFSTEDSAQHGAVYLAAPVPGMPKINLINMSVKPDKLKVNKSIETDGRIFMLKSVPTSDLLWAGVQSAAGDYNVLQFIDKKP